MFTASFNLTPKTCNFCTFVLKMLPVAFTHICRYSRQQMSAFYPFSQKWTIFSPNEMRESFLKASCASPLAQTCERSLNDIFGSALFFCQPVFQSRSAAYLIFVISLHSHIFYPEILHSKVRKFTTKKASRQNSVNYHHPVCKIIPCV